MCYQEICPKTLRDHLSVQASAINTPEKQKVTIEKYLQANVHKTGNSPMDVDWLAKGKGGGKGGKGDKGGKQHPPNRSSSQGAKLTGERNWCRKMYHMENECWNKATGKPRTPKQPQKGDKGGTGGGKGGKSDQAHKGGKGPWWNSKKGVWSLDEQGAWLEPQPEQAVDAGADGLFMDAVEVPRGSAVGAGKNRYLRQYAAEDWQAWETAHQEAQKLLQERNQYKRPQCAACKSEEKELTSR